MQKTTKAIAFAMALTLVMVMLPTFAAVFHSDVRVKLSIGSGRSFTFTPVASEPTSLPSRRWAAGYP